MQTMNITNIKEETRNYYVQVNHCVYYAFQKRKKKATN